MFSLARVLMIWVGLFLSAQAAPGKLNTEVVTCIPDATYELDLAPCGEIDIVYRVVTVHPPLASVMTPRRELLEYDARFQTLPSPGLFYSNSIWNERRDKHA